MARVDFPKGVLTQCGIQGVRDFRPTLAAAGSVGPNVPATLSDPARRYKATSRSLQRKCAARSLARCPQAGWIGALLRCKRGGATPEKPLPSAPLEQFGWGYARARWMPIWSKRQAGKVSASHFIASLSDFRVAGHGTSGNRRQNHVYERLRRIVAQVFLLSDESRARRVCGSFRRHCQHNPH